MWQPSRAQWWTMSTVAAVLVLAWPPDRANESSLAVKAVHWAADPAGTLPSLPPPLPMGLDDDGDAVAAHDALEADYYRQYSSSRSTRLRLRLKELRDPIDPVTERQLLIGLAVFGALGVWKLNSSRQ